MVSGFCCPNVTDQRRQCNHQYPTTSTTVLSYSPPQVIILTSTTAWAQMSIFPSYQVWAISVQWYLFIYQPRVHGTGFHLSVTDIHSNYLWLIDFFLNICLLKGDNVILTVFFRSQAIICVTKMTNMFHFMSVIYISAFIFYVESKDNM